MNQPLEITALAYGGSGIGRRDDGKLVFVPCTAPGDIIHWRTVKEKKRHLEGELLQLLSGGPGRCDPVCPLFGRCGGCQWQHLAYPRQTAWKHRLLSDTLTRHAGSAVELLPALPSPDEWHYRNRVQFKCHLTAAGPVIGFYRRGSHFVIPVDHCPIARREINQSLDFLQQLLNSSPNPERIPQIDVAVGDDAAVRVVCHHLGAVEPSWVKTVRDMAEERHYALFLQQGRKASLRHIAGAVDLSLLVDEPPLTLGFGPGGFAQVNSAQNRQLVAAVVLAAGLQGRERVLDLYCGMGNFSLPLARRAGQVVGVEDYPTSIAQARLNARANGLDNLLFQVADVANFLAANDRRFDLVVLDPPRSGAGKAVVQALCKLAPARIIYVSCDPMTLARDLAPLLNNGYRLLSGRPFDLFPQTYHIESLVVLQRS